MNPQLRIIENTRTGTAIVLGSNHDAVQEAACNLVMRGYVPVEDEYFLMEHRRTKKRANFRKVSFVNKFNHE